MRQSLSWALVLLAFGFGFVYVARGQEGKPVDERPEASIRRTQPAEPESPAARGVPARGNQAAAPRLVTTSAPPSSAIKVKIEAAEDNRKLLLNKLNEQGTKHGLKFELGDPEFVCRIEFAISYVALPSGSASDTYASAKVYDGQGMSLFSLERNSRSPFVNQDARVANAVAKEIVKRLLKAPARLPSQSTRPLNSSGSSL